MRRLGVKLALLATLAASAWALWPRGEAVGEAVTRLPDEKAASPAWMGVSSCAASACHHNNGPRGSKLSEYSTWAAHDKHAQAFQVLHNDRSRAMVRNLFGEGKDVKPATEQTLCLKCHASGNGDPLAKGPRFQLGDGVGCESCHGPAENWLSKHYQTQYKSDSSLAALGMWPTKDLAFRAQLCAGCHVGDAATGKEANHDLYAAGHPRLNFEFAAYHAQYPKHWNIEEDKARYPDFDARAWALGQSICARTSLAMLKKHADSAAKKTAPWPEFAEYDCFACHKNLKPDSPRQKAGYGDRLPGSLPWGKWTWSEALPFAKESNANIDEKQWLELRDEMERASPRPAEVSRLSSSLLTSVNDWSEQLKKGGLDPVRLRQLAVRRLQEVESRVDSLTWDEATQLYLLLQAASSGRPTPALRDFRQELIKAFELPGEKGQTVESPANFDPAKLRESLRLLRATRSDK